MRVFLSTAVMGLLLVPAIAKAECSYAMGSADELVVSSKPAVSNELSAAKKKEKVEYMKSAAGPEPASPKKKKKK